MLRTRVIPCLLLSDSDLVKTVKFAKPRYIGDPVNAVKIFNEKEVDEIIFLDISRLRSNKKPNFGLIEELASECFMPMTYGGGVKNMDHVKKLFNLGIEKVAVGSAAYENPGFLNEIANQFGAQSVVLTINIKRTVLGKYRGYDPGRRRSLKGQSLEKFLTRFSEVKFGEVLVNDVDREGTGLGYDCELIRYLSLQFDTPVTICGGAAKIDDFKTAVEAGAHAVCAGSMFVYHGPRQAVLINYPPYKQLCELLD